MAICTRIKGERREICIGDMDRVVTLQTRALGLDDNNIDATEVFVSDPGEVFALVKTVRGETYFDGVNQERDITHHFYTYYIPGFTAESWALLDGERYDVLEVEDLDERHVFMLLRATNRGLDSKVASNA